MSEDEKQEPTATVTRGVPTAPTVRAIEAEYPNLKPGDLVLYEDLERIIMEERHTCRWKTCVKAWRGAMRIEHNVMMECVPNTGYRVLDNPGRIEASSRRYKHGVKRIIIAGIDANDTGKDGLSVSQIRSQEHMQRQSSLYVLQEKTRPKELF